MMRILLDTNVYCAYLQGSQDALDVLVDAAQVYVSVIVLGELKAGFQGGTRSQTNKQRLAQFLSKPRVRVLSVDEETSDVFGMIKHQLQSNGTPIPLNDVWIAAQAIQTGAVLATYDRHFEDVAGVRLWDVLNR